MFGISNAQLTVKLVTLFSLLISSAIAGLLPATVHYLSKILREKKDAEKGDPSTTTKGSSSLSNMVSTLSTFLNNISQGFAAGILAGGGFLHLLPEANEEINEVLEKWEAPTWVVSFPWAMMACLSAISILFFMDSVIGRCAARMVASSMNTRTKTAINNTSNNTYNTFGDAYQSKQSVDEHVDHQVEVEEEESNGEEEEDRITNWNDQISLFLSAFLLWLSLCIHSFFEGLGLGVTTDDTQMWTLFVAIVSHKLFASYALGAFLAQSFMNTEKVKKGIIAIIILVIPFSLMTPIGIGIGMGLSSIENDVFTLIQHLVLSLAAGTFIFVSLFEILANHHHHHQQHHHHHHHKQHHSHHQQHHSHHHHHNPHHESSKAKIIQEELLNSIRFPLFVLGILMMALLKVFDV